jgi:hypothetical protein
VPADAEACKAAKERQGARALATKRRPAASANSIVLSCPFGALVLAIGPRISGLDGSDLAAPLIRIDARAREIGYTHLAEEILEISDNAKGDFVEGEDGWKAVDREHIARARLRVDTRKCFRSQQS